MVVRTDTERTRHSRRLVLELLGSSVDLSLTGERGPVERRVRRRPRRASGQPPRRSTSRSRSTTRCTCATTPSASSATSASTPAASSGSRRGRSASPGAASTPASPPSTTSTLPDSACVYCGNCIQVCPTGALMFTSEHEMRAAGTWDEERQTQTDTICPYCGVGLHADPARPGQRDRQGRVTARQRGHPRQPLHQGPLRLPTRPEPPARLTTRRRRSRRSRPCRTRAACAARRGGRGRRRGRRRSSGRRARRRARWCSRSTPRRPRGSGSRSATWSTRRVEAVVADAALGEPPAQLGLVVAQHVDAELAGRRHRLPRVAGDLRQEPDERRVERHRRERPDREPGRHVARPPGDDGDAGGEVTEHLAELATVERRVGVAISVAMRTSASEVARSACVTGDA